MDLIALYAVMLFERIRKTEQFTSRLWLQHGMGGIRMMLTGKVCFQGVQFPFQEVSLEALTKISVGRSKPPALTSIFLYS